MGGKITALVVQKRNKERVNVYLDGEFAFGLALIEAIKLQKGQQLDNADIERLKALDEIEVAHEHALNYLSYRPRSVEEVRRNLRQSKKKFSETTVETVIERLERSGLLDEAAFARYWVENRSQFKPRSARALRYELRQKGVSDPAIQAAMEDLDEETEAYRAAQSRMHRYAQADEETFRKRLGDFLSRRGFSYSIVRTVLDQLWEEKNAQYEPAPNNINLDGEVT
ncbi:MAG: RecX family transcriptional regulator [Anaerolineae bacterium]|nr:RecX family transcriptional regulator [Anaerolineae bacterium]